MKTLIKILRAPLDWFKKLYTWTLHWAKTKQAARALFGIAFVESSFFPIPPDVLLIAMTVAYPKKWWRYALICTAGSVLGALFGYFIGWFFFEAVGKIIVNTYHLENIVEVLRVKYQQNAFLTVFTAAFTPIPYKAITITAGLFKISLRILVVASIIGRAGRFYLVAGSLRVFGKRIADSIEKYFDIFSIIFVLLLVGGFLCLKFISH
jgi:membrane protein YqaA with SNARE-associated domain